jgi:phosphoribosyl 1,2-cyclic phosphate phosphodiesterase
VRVLFLGTGTSTGVPVPTCDCRVCRSDDPKDRRLRPSVLLRWDSTTVLIDTAPDLRQQALRHGIERIDAVLYTHAHADHVLGLDDLRLYNWRQCGPVPAYGSPATLESLARTFWYVFGANDPHTTRPSIDCRPIEQPIVFHGQTVTPVPALHGALPIFGYRVGRFAYLTDVSAIPQASRELLRGLDVLVLNALRERPHPTHMDLASALAEAQRIGARRTLLTHLSHEMHHASVSAALPPSITLAHDGLELEVADDGGAEA